MQKDKKFSYGCKDDKRLNELKLLEKYNIENHFKYEVSSKEILDNFINLCNISYEIEDNYGAGSQFGLYKYIFKTDNNIKVIFSGEEQMK